MADIVDRATRSRMMAGIRGRDTKPEITVRRYLHRRGFRFRLRGRRLPGRPDIVLPKYAAVVMVHGCFWHSHNGCKYAYKPKSNKSFWREKLAGNAARDNVNRRRLAKLGWRVFTVWECQVDRSEVMEALALRIHEGTCR
jgi:DNA mismatch endonuclease (patch repair protein)